MNVIKMQRAEALSGLGVDRFAVLQHVGRPDLRAPNFCMLLSWSAEQGLAADLGFHMHSAREGLIPGPVFILLGFVAIMSLIRAYAN